jgi:hypothetical protein
MMLIDTDMFSGVPGPPAYPLLSQLKPAGGWLSTNADTEAYELRSTQYLTSTTWCSVNGMEPLSKRWSSPAGFVGAAIAPAGTTVRARSRLAARTALARVEPRASAAHPGGSPKPGGTTDPRRSWPRLGR